MHLKKKPPLTSLTSFFLIHLNFIDTKKKIDCISDNNFCNYICIIIIKKNLFMIVFDCMFCDEHEQKCVHVWKVSRRQSVNKYLSQTTDLPIQEKRVRFVDW